MMISTDTKEATKTAPVEATAEAGLPGIPDNVELRFRELRSCCYGTIYGYMDQFGREYDTEKVPLTAGMKLTDPDAA